MKEEIEPNEDFRLYSKHIRNHSIVNGNDVLVLLSEYGRLLFMSIYHEGAIRRYETLSEVQLSSPGLEYDKIGKKLAVDPYGRAIAVASFEDNMDVFILHKTSSRSYFDPISVRVSIAEEGIIWHMEFLHTESTSRERILLAVVIYSDIEKICRVILYSMNASTDDVTIETIGRLPLEKNTPLPVLLIPLKFMHESFILVTEQQVCLLSSDDLGCGNVLYPTSYIPRELGSTEYPLFTAYSPHLNPSEHYLYLGAAEGLLYKLQVNVSTSTMQWISIDDVNPVSQAMCMVGELIHSDDGKDLSTADIIFYTGESSNSQMIAITQEETTNNKLHYRTLQIFDNWAPITNFQVASNLRSYQDALVTCSGQDKYGSLGVVSYGVDAILLFSSKPEWKGVSQLWSLSLSSTMAVSYLVASSLIDTRLISFEDGHMKDITFPSKIRNNLHTLHANIFSIKGINYLLQIYSNGISITQRDENRGNYYST
ncbi:mono-functional DNA-alkylating methyl methanesulfonate N-term-domain-containing protein [Pilobolus umbonatus]|nr:mono-functional DNA-alkylating methyl methanesulfonate N-term-domain-containing protein [Pilobolus umbonatus]